MRVPKKTIIYLGAAFLLTVAIFVTPLIVFGGSLNIIESINEILTPQQRVTTTVSFADANRLAYDVEAISVDRFGATLNKAGSTGELIMMNAAILQREAHITDFIENSETPPDTSITYQVSTNSKNWLYHDGIKWKPVNDCEDCSNTAQELSSKLNELLLESDNIRIKAILSSKGDWMPTLRAVDIISEGRGVYLPLDRASEEELNFALASDKGSGGSGGSDCECDGKATTLTLRYNGANAATVRVWQKKSEVNVYNDIVQPNGIFTFYGADRKGTLGTEISVYINEVLDVAIHTSCSQPLEIGMSFGQFTVIDGASLHGGQFCTSTSENLPPVAVDDYEETLKNTPVNIDILENDYDQDGWLVPSSVTIVPNTGPEHGTLSINSDTGVVTYQPDTGFVGTDTFDYKVCDNGSGLTGDSTSGGSKKDCKSGKSGKSDGTTCNVTDPLCASATVTIVIKDSVWNGPNLGVSAECYKNKEVKFTISNSGPDPEGDMTSPTEYRIYRDDVLETTGTIELDGGQDKTISHPAGYYNVIRIEVDQVPGHPTGNMAEAEMTECGDCECEGGVTTLSLVYNSSTSANIVVDTKDGEVFNDVVEGNCAFSFVGLGSGGKLGSSIDVYVNGTLDTSIHTSCSQPIEIGMTFGSFTVAYGESKYNGRLCGGLANDPPVAVDDFAETASGAAVTVDLLANDYDPDGDEFELTRLIQVIGPNHGFVTPNLTNGTATYTSNEGYEGEDYFEYEICEISTEGDPNSCNPWGSSAIKCDQGKVTITVVPPPYANLEASGTCQKKSDHYEAEFTIMNTGPLGQGDMDSPTDYRIYENDVEVDSGTVQLDAGYSTLVSVTAESIAYTYRIEVDQLPGHPSGVMAEASVTNCGPGDNLPPIAEDDYVSLGVSTPENPTSIDISVLDNDSDPDGDPLRLDDILTEPQQGTLSVDYDTGIVTYVPDDYYSGYDSFEYKMFDVPSGLATPMSDTAWVYITVSPVAEDDEAWAQAGQSVEISVLSNDSDIDGVLVPDTVTYVTGTLSPDYGSVSVNSTTGTMIYTSVANQGNYDVTFDYTVEDDDGNEARATVTVHVSLTPPPQCLTTALDDYVTAVAGTPVTIQITGNDSCSFGRTIDTSSLELIAQDQAAATITFDKTTGSAIYTGPGGINQDQFTYQVCNVPNPEKCCDEAVVHIKFGGGPSSLPDPPVAVDDSTSTKVNVPVDIQVLINDYDVDGDLDKDSLTLLTGTGNEPQHGSVELVPGTHLVRYIPDPDFIGQDTFKYSVSDLRHIPGEEAIATVTIDIMAGSLIPPIANDDSVTTPYETPVTIPVLGNDFDPDGTLINSTMLMTRPPSYGTASATTITGSFIYIPINGFIGFDSFDYKICDNDGLCDTARVSINVLPPFIPPPILPPAIPPIVIPTPIVPVAPDIITLNCGEQLHTTGTLDMTGSYFGDIADVNSFEYSITDGLSWRPISDFTATPTGASFAFTLNDLQSGEYRIRARAIVTGGTVAGSVSSISCPLTIDTGLVFGANQFILGAQPSPMADNGTVHFIVNQRHRFYLEARGASEAFLRVVDTDETFPLVWDTELKLWTGELAFADEGFYRLEATIANTQRAYTREINSIMVTRGTDITDRTTNAIVNGLTVTVYERSPDDDSFKLWNAQAYAQSNPDRVDGSFAFVVPPGEFYITIEHPDYDKITSLITSVPEQSVISANIELDTERGLFSRLSRLISPSGTTNNFALNVRPAPDTDLLSVGDALPNIQFTTVDETTTSLDDLLDEADDRPTVLFVYSTWNTNAQMQVDIYKRLAAAYDGQVNLVPVATMEPTQLKASQISRGSYEFDFLQPNDQFYEDYYVISLPAFYAIDAERNLVGKLFGPHSESAIADWIDTTFSL